ncbi:MAG: hypothetical protein ACK4JF_04465 [Methylohalobius sp.]
MKTEENTKEEETTITETEEKPQEETTSQEAQASSFSRLKQSLKAGVCDASQAVEKTFTTLGRLASKTVYGTCYGASYGVTFAALGIARVLPETMLRGFKEGAEAAEQTLERKLANPSETAEQPA